MTKLFPKNIYKYKAISGEIGLCVYICDTDNSNEIVVGCIEEADTLNTEYIKMSNGLNKVLYLNRYLILKTDSILGPLFLKGIHINVTSEEFQKLTSSIYKLLLLKLENVVFNFSNNNYKIDALKDITFPEKLIKQLIWTIKKIDLKFNEQINSLKIMEHCVYFAYLGTNIGAEINKLRPVVIWRKHENKELNHKDDCYYVFPLSSKRSKNIYKHNVYLDINGQREKLMINQGRILSRQRFIKPYLDSNTQKVIKLTDKDLNAIKESIKYYFGV